VNREVEALLIVQQHDEVIRGIEARRDAFSPRVAALDATRQRAVTEVGRQELALTKEQERHRALEARIAEHRERHEKNLEVLNHAHKLKEATAAMAQVEAARRVLADEESELLTVNRRLGDLRAAITAAREELESLDASQSEVRASIAAERSTINAELAAAQALRVAASAGVERGLLSKYDRLASRRRAPALFALHRDFSCGACDTAISMQRRPAMSTGAVIDVCEGCGVLVYFVPVAPA
jgi:predicted  nucleic acid-binding Zn-ribbon protein